MAETIDAIELGEFVKKLVSDIEGSVERKLFDPIEIEISISKSQKLGGDLKLYVASGDGGREKETIAKVCFKVPPLLRKDADWSAFYKYHRYYKPPSSM